MARAISLKVYFWGALFGLFVTAFGLFAGLQLWPSLGTVLVFPFVLAAYITNTGFGQFAPAFQAFLFLLTSGFWGMVFVLLYHAVPKH